VVRNKAAASRRSRLPVVDEGQPSLPNLSVTDRLTPLAAFAPGVMLIVASTYVGHSETLGMIGGAFIASNLTILIYVAAPLFALVGVMLHRLLWPMLSHVAYPLSRYKIVSNRKLLVTLSGLTLGYAFQLESIGARELLKLLG
jgi:hypothetical protein